jgi:sulfatase modifying factor 1
MAAVSLASAAEPGMVQIPSGDLALFFPRKTVASVAVAAFLLDRRPVTNGEFLDFLRRHPEWQRSKVKPLFADQHYLEHWQDDLTLPHAARSDQPVTNVSWFSATAYCEAHGKGLPSTDQWEYALADQGRDAEGLRNRILAWYSTPNHSDLPNVESLTANGFGVRGLTGAVWEWTEDFNSAMSGPELREAGVKNKDLFCGGASISAKDATDYAAFMRFSMRVSLKARYATDNLGFRCAKEISP